ncbi:hypothetical protein IWW50_004180 [Coemansia erecta]|nr:hypothetical protein GGF43_004629 [Coemansia sp. RSA 2618]KAJ2822513.1 hypothetical protein IWW50_004180 [Coemansia erecta]
MAVAANTCEQSLAKAYDVVAKIDKLVEKAYEAHSSIYKTFGDLSGISTIRKDKSVVEAAHTDISSTLEAMQSMIGTLAQLDDVVVQLEKKPREQLISKEVHGVLNEFSPYVRLVTEQRNVRETSELIDGSVGELDASAMRLRIGDFGEGIGEGALAEQLAALRERYPQLDIKVHKVSKRTQLLVVRIPTVIQMSVNMKQLDAGNEAQELEINSINIFSDDESGPFSKFHVFNRISYDSNIIWSSIAGFSVEHRISKIVQWFSMFDNLFSATCSICHRHLQMDPRTSQHLPPIWRDLDAKVSGPCKAFHYGCLESA